VDSNLAHKLSQENAERLWFIARGNVLKGPFSSALLKEKIQKREFSFLDFCWRQGFNEWRPLGAVEDFDRRTKFKRLPQYPSVEVPTSSGGGIYLKDTAPPEGEGVNSHRFLKRLPEKKSLKHHSNEGSIAGERSDGIFKNREKFEVSFARQKRFSITIYEWGFAVMFAVVLSYFVSDYALTELNKNLSLYLGQLTAGTVEERGSQNSAAVSPKFWEPLFSAPAYHDMNSLSKTWALGTLPPLKLEVLIEGMPERRTGNDVKVNDFSVLSQSPLNVWASSSESLDPIYIRPLKIFGTLDLKNPSNIQVPQRNSPFIEE